MCKKHVMSCASITKGFIILMHIKHLRVEFERQMFWQIFLFQKSFVIKWTDDKWLFRQAVSKIFEFRALPIIDIQQLVVICETGITYDPIVTYFLFFTSFSCHSPFPSLTLFSALRVLLSIVAFELFKYISFFYFYFLSLFLLIFFFFVTSRYITW